VHFSFAMLPDDEGYAQSEVFTISDRFSLELEFWGLGGSLGTAQYEVLGFGGNTTCL
jgi:hypothetical protein